MTISRTACTPGAAPDSVAVHLRLHVVLQAHLVMSSSCVSSSRRVPFGVENSRKACGKRSRRCFEKAMGRGARASRPSQGQSHSSISRVLPDLPVAEILRLGGSRKRRRFASDSHAYLSRISRSCGPPPQAPVSNIFACRSMVVGVKFVLQHPVEVTTTSLCIGCMIGSC